MKIIKQVVKNNNDSTAQLVLKTPDWVMEKIADLPSISRFGEIVGRIKKKDRDIYYYVIDTNTESLNKFIKMLEK